LKIVAGEVLGVSARGAINLVESLLDTGTGWRRGRFGGGGVQGQATSAAAEEGGEVKNLSDLCEACAARLGVKSVNDFERRFEHLFVEQPFLEAEALGAVLPIRSFAAEKLVESLAGGGGAMVVKGGGAGLPIVTRREPAEAVKGEAEGGCGFAQAARGGELQPVREGLIVGRGLVWLARPGMRGVRGEG
jgi:hypothetical protein